jgi:outer membrane protein OmpA-like peptidoglycan-associated protein
MTRLNAFARNLVSHLTLGLFVLPTLSACGAAVAPEVLMTAREKVAKAEQGTPAQLAPVQLEEAKQALAEADKAFSDGEDDEVIADLAYIADRKAQIAESTAGYEGAKRFQEGADKQERDLQEELVESAEKKAQKTQAQLDEERRKAQQTQAELDKERSARLDAEKKLSSALKSLNEVAQVKEEQRGIVITLTGSVLFAAGKYKLLPIAKDRLDEVAKALIDQGFKAITVEGHTDSKGSASANLDLSQNRADEVRTYLVSKGIPPAKIKAVGRGEEKPVADNTSTDGQANNRRVEIVVEPE